jgi:putative ABC transport system permease protein
MKAVGFAWRTLVRQPARAVLAVLGVAAAGALLLDMLLLSNGLVASMRDLLERTGWDVRVTRTGDAPRRGPRITSVAATLEAMSALSGVRSAVAVRAVDAAVETAAHTPLVSLLQGASGGAPPPWTVLRGTDARERGEVVLNESASAALEAEPGREVTVRASCATGDEALPPVQLRITGIAAFPFEIAREHMLGATLDTLAVVCGGGEAADQADIILVQSTGDPSAAAAAITAMRPDLRAVTNDDMVGRLEQNEFTYFRQISTVLTTVTLSFAVLLITVLITVSVNQRLGEIAALRALGFSRSRVVADVLAESALIVALGGLASLPLGMLMARWLDGILKGIPGIPAAMHFFVYEESTLALHIALLATTALVAALYPMRIVSRLPIAATLRDEVTE